MAKHTHKHKQMKRKVNRPNCWHMAQTKYHLQFSNTMSSSPPKKHKMHFFCSFPNVFINNKNSQPIMALLCVYMQNALTHPFTVFILTNYAVFISKVKMLKKSQLKKKNAGIFSGL